jgi:hypothetical protein
MAAGAAQLGLDVAGGAPGDDVRRRGLPMTWSSDGDATVFTYNVVRLGLNTAGGASGDDARRRGLPTAQDSEGDTIIFIYNAVLSGMLPLVPTCPLPHTGLVPKLSMLGSCCRAHGVMRSGWWACHG